MKSIPLEPHFYIEKNWGLQGYTYFFLFLLQNIDCGYRLETPHRGDSNEHPQALSEQKKKNSIPLHTPVL